MPGLSEIPWDDNQRYPHSKGCYGTSSKVFLPTSSTEVIRRTGFKDPTRSSENPNRLHLLMAPTNSGSGLFIPFIHCGARSSKFSAAHGTGMKDGFDFVMTTGFFRTFR